MKKTRKTTKAKKKTQKTPKPGWWRKKAKAKKEKKKMAATPQKKPENLSALIGKKPAKKSKKRDDLASLIGKPKAKTPKKPKDELDDLIGAPPAPAIPKVGEPGYTPMVRPKAAKPEGIWAARAALGENLGKTCLACKKPLKYNGGRPPIICRGSKPCFRAYRNLYRRDYDAARAAKADAT